MTKNEISLCENLLEFWVIRTQFWFYQINPMTYHSPSHLF